MPPPRHIHMLTVLTPSVMIFGCRVFGRPLGLYWVTRVGPHDGSNVLIKRGRDTASVTAFHHLRYNKTPLYKPGTGSQTPHLPPP